MTTDQAIEDCRTSIMPLMTSSRLCAYEAIRPPPLPRWTWGRAG